MSLRIRQILYNILKYAVVLHISRTVIAVYDGKIHSCEADGFIHNP